MPGLNGLFEMADMILIGDLALSTVEVLPLIYRTLIQEPSTAMILCPLGQAIPDEISTYN